MIVYNILDWFFTVFHTLLIVFSLFGWIWKPLRKLNLAALLLTAASWFIAGIFYGIGYCPLTDWHWSVLRELGETGLPHSYPQYLINRATGIQLQPLTADIITGTSFGVAFVISSFLNARDFIKKKKQAEKPQRKSHK